MGAYLAQPLKDKCSEDGEGNHMKFGVSCMQGWRVTQEDSHNCDANFDDKSSLFAVYDGHGGSEVALFLSRNFPGFLKDMDNYKKGELKEALHDGFVKIDEYIKSESGLALVQALAQEAKTSNKTSTAASTECDDEDVGELYEEATMPIEMLVAKYKKGLISHVTQSQLDNAENVRPCSSKAVLRDISIDAEVKGENLTCGSRSSNSQVLLTPTIEPEIAPKTIEDESTTDKENGQRPKSIEQETATIVETASEVSEVKHGQRRTEAKVVQKSKSETQKIEIEKEVNGCADIADGVLQNGVSNNLEMKDENSVVLSSEDRREESILIESTSVKTRRGKVHPTRMPVPTPVPCERKLKSKKIYKDFVNSESASSDSEDCDEAYVGIEGSGSDDSTSSAAEPAENSELSSEDEEEDGTENDSDDEEDLLADVQEPGFDSGSTAVVAFLKWQTNADLLDLWVANAGDSRCTVSREGKALDMSHDHKPEDEEEARRIVTAGGKVTVDGRVNGGLNLSRAIGDHSYKQNTTLSLEEQMITPVPDIQHIVLNPRKDDFIVLACDGVWNSMSSQEVVDFVTQKLKTESQLSSICEHLFDACLATDTSGDGTGCDNMTAIIIKLSPKNSTNDNGKRNRSTPSPGLEDCKRMKVEETN